VTRLLVLLVRLYQLTFASLFGGRCRFTPSCSAYAIEALRTHGTVHGGRLAVWRVMRCSPMCTGGHDPVPPAGSVTRRAKPLPCRVEPDAA
jgi:uncharacterized protein